MSLENNEPQFPDILPFYNHQGRAVCYLFGGQYFYLYNGKPVAWLHMESISTHTTDAGWVGCKMVG